MATSSQQFFDIPELATQVALQLTRSDISRLCRTNQALHSHCSPVLFKTITYLVPSDIFVSGPSTQTFGRYSHHVKDLTFRSDELAYYYNCVQSFEEFKAQTTDISTPGPPRPHWHPLPDPHACPVFAIPPLTRLSQLALHFVDPRASKIKVASADNPRTLLAQLCWLITLNPHLTSLTVQYLSLKAVSYYPLFFRTIAQLNGLERLDILLECPYQRGFRQGLEIFNRLQPCIKTFIYRYYQLSYDEPPGDQDGSGEQGGGSGGSGLVMTPKRQGTLPNVTDLQLWKIGEETSLMDVVSIFAQLPNLEELQFTEITGQHNIEAIGKFIGKECPKIHSLSYTPDGLCDANDLLPYLIAIGLPPQQLTRFKDMGFCSDFDHPSARIVIHQHSTTLRELILGQPQGASYMVSPDVIFDNCVNLEVLSMSMSVDSGGVFIDLVDTQGALWCCTKLQELTIAISGCELPEEHEDEETPVLPYYARPHPITLTEAETQHFSRLERLYIQIGRLTELQYLKMNMINPDEYDETDSPIWLCDDQIQTVPPSFPAMLSLGSTLEGRPGYLHHLAELSKLECITGSIRADTEENKATMELKECVWIDQHWPLLNRAIFFRNEENIRAPFTWLMNQRKHGREELQLS
ncbi:hypothetical protein BGZ95_005933 [Linnemannia exigua]|uniref:Uncharacterized protein n=1 Tax=Linnemannia exigua TaxID=604196 RepID=A0AAD4DGC6_9FUNG|nr:hypothetical protein BGZ95_005933 [Linnemannia exigua]